MSRGNRNFVAAIAMATAFVANIAAAAPFVPSALPLARFYPTQLASTPVGVNEDPQVWLAKVQGLLADAPSLLQQSLLASQTAQDFAANVALLQQMQEGILKQGALDMTSQGKKSQAKSGRIAPQALGDASNLVYKPLEPCRIMDTRNATAGSGVQGPIAGGSLKQIPGFITAGSNWSIYGQTGTPSDCGLTNPPGTFIHGVAIVITILNPNFDAFLGVGDINSLPTTLSTVALNYTHGQGLSTMYIVPQLSSNIIYFAMPTALSAHLIFDVVGYFVVSDATALQCAPQSSAPAAIAAASTGSVTSPACAAGYTLSGGSCDSTSFSMSLVSHEASGGNTSWFCSANNTGGSSANLTAIANCCRVPGK
jgi:hypothetical protein